MKKYFILSVCAAIIGLLLYMTYRIGPLFGFYLFPPSVQEYVRHAVLLMDQNGIYSNTATWDSIRQETLEAAKVARTYEETHDILEKALKVVGGKHSFLSVASKSVEGEDMTMQSPVVRLDDDGILYVMLPQFTGSPKQGDEYATKAYELIRQHKENIKGVIIDLRHNTGGDMGPMITAISPFLPDGEFISWGIKGRKIPVVLEKGKAIGGGTPISISEPFKVEDKPIAILQDSLTCSSGEIVLLAFRGLPHTRTFGTHSGGYCSSNMSYHLYDGTIMQLTNGKDVARTGEEFCEYPIAPDEECNDADEKAKEWLESIIRE